MDFIDWVYDSLNGQLEESYAVAGVENAFAEGSDCSEYYEQMRETYARLRERLGVVDEDSDVEIIIRCLECIQKELCSKMYYYGTIFGSKTPSALPETLFRRE